MLDVIAEMASKSSLAPELRVSELEAELQAKSLELKSVRERLRTAEDEKERLQRQLRLSASQYSAELEARIAALESENYRLKALQTLEIENERLQLELQHSIQLRVAFEEKFKETKVKLLSLEQDSGNIETWQQENETLRRELRVAQGNSEKVRSLEKELDSLKHCYDRLYQETRQEAMAYATAEEQPETPRVLYQTPAALLSESRPSIRSKPRSESSPASQLSNSKLSAVSTASYCPTYLRTKRSKPPAKKVCSRFLRLDAQRETFEGVEPKALSG